MVKDIKELFELIPNYPGLNICLVDNFDLKESFFELIEKQDAILYIKNFKNEDIKGNNFIKVERFDFGDKRYNLHSILYDFVFLLIDTQELDLQEVLKKFYRVIKNAGYIYLFAKDNHKEKVMKLLGDTNFVSINDIDTYGESHIISAQKMHGWMKV